MKSLLFIAGLTLGIGTATAGAYATLQLSPGVTSEINVTADSSRGWIPTAEQRQRAIKTLEVFLDAVEEGRYAEAYGMETEINKGNQTLAQFSQDARQFRVLAGPIKFWRVLKVTWTKDPARAPFPGIYAAIDLAGQFANVDRDCGYVVLYQKTANDEFTIMRRENNYVDNTTARNIEETQSKAELKRIWARLSGNCPNYSSSVDGQ